MMRLFNTFILDFAYILVTAYLWDITPFHWHNCNSAGASVDWLTFIHRTASVLFTWRNSSSSQLPPWWELPRSHSSMSIVAFHPFCWTTLSPELVYLRISFFNFRRSNFSLFETSRVGSPCGKDYIRTIMICWREIISPSDHTKRVWQTSTNYMFIN